MSQYKVKDSQMALDGWDKEVERAFVENPCTCVYCGFRATSYRAWCQLVLDHPNSLIRLSNAAGTRIRGWEVRVGTPCRA